MDTNMTIPEQLQLFAIGGIVASTCMLLILSRTGVGRIHTRVVDGLYAFPWGLLCISSIGTTVQLDPVWVQVAYGALTLWPAYVTFMIVMRAWRPGVWLPHTPVTNYIRRRFDDDEKPPVESQAEPQA